MFDTVKMCLSSREAAGVDFLDAVPPFLDDYAEHYKSNEMYGTGKVGNLSMVLTTDRLTVTRGSLCKYHFGDNFQTMGRRDVQEAIERLSDALHLPMGEATVSRLDIAQNFIMKHPPTVYFNRLGATAGFSRLEQPDSVYFTQSQGQQLVFYDKAKEQKKHREPIPDLYQGRNVLRYEQRYLKSPSKRLKVPKITAAMLYSEQFYIKALGGYADAYDRITKVNSNPINFEAVKGKRDLYLYYLREGIKRDGYNELMNSIRENAQRGILTPKQAADIRKAIRGAAQGGNATEECDEVIEELNKKVKQAIRNYR